MSVKCINCGRKPGDDGCALFRQNPKGEIGVWACDLCKVPPHDDAQLVAEIQHALAATAREGR